MAQKKHFDKLAPLPPTELGRYSGEQRFEAAFEAFVCGFLMRMAGQDEKAEFLRWYSTHLMEEDSVKSNGKNWNDVNFPGALEGLSASEAYAKQFNISEAAAAEKIVRGPRCSRLNEFTERALRPRVKPSDERGAWQITKAPGIIRYATHGTTVHGHQFGFAKISGQCGVDILWLSWSSYRPQITRLVGAEFTFLVDVDGTSFEIGVELKIARSITPLLTMAVFTNFLAGPAFTDLLTQGKRVTITISGPKEAIQSFDIPSDEFSLAGYQPVRRQAEKACEELTKGG